MHPEKGGGKILCHWRAYPPDPGSGTTEASLCDPFCETDYPLLKSGGSIGSTIEFSPYPRQSPQWQAVEGDLPMLRIPLEWELLSDW